MSEAIISLFWISVVAVLAPLIAGAIPRRLVPEVVLLIALGVVIGPFVAGLADTDGSIELLRELGLAMLFLLAGFEIEPAELTGRAGRRALATWLLCLCLALGLVALVSATDVLDAEIAVAIALTSTALGTLLPILKDRGLMRTPTGVSVLRHGAYGELGPVIAIAIFLGVQGPIHSLVVLAAFAGLAVLLSIPSIHLRRGTSRILGLIRTGAETTSQTAVRLTMLLLVALLAAATALNLDIVLAAFAAGFILRLAIPDGDEHLESRIEGIAFGFLVPIFFVTSGMAIDPGAIAGKPGGFVAIIALFLLARGLPVGLLSHLAPTELRLGVRDSVAVGLFAATGLPIIVAVTSLSVSAGYMSSDNASLLVAAGAASVLVFPLLATLTLGSADRDSTRTPTSGPRGRPRQA